MVRVQLQCREIRLYVTKILKLKSYDLFSLIQELWYTTHLLPRLFRPLTTGLLDEVGKDEAGRQQLLNPLLEYFSKVNQAAFISKLSSNFYDPIST